MVEFYPRSSKDSISGTINAPGRNEFPLKICKEYDQQNNLPPMTCEGYDGQILHFTNLSMGQDQPDCYPLFSSCPLECLRMGEMIYMKVFRVRYK